MDVARRLKSARELAGKTQTQVSKDTGINNKTLSGYERNVSEPDLATFQLLADYYSVSLDYLLGKTSDPELTRKDERDILKKLDSILSEMNSTDALMFDGEEVTMDEESIGLLKSSLENSIRLAKKLAKEKYTPNKYKK